MVIKAYNKYRDDGDLSEELLYNEMDEISLDQNDIDSIFNENKNKMGDYLNKTKIPKVKFTKENLEKLKFGSIQKMLSISDSHEAYLGAYSEVEFLAYRFSKTHGFYPDILSMRNIKTNKFINKLFGLIGIPLDSYFQSTTYHDDNAFINSFILSIKINKYDIYIILDEGDATLLYNKTIEKNDKESFDLIIGLLKTHAEPQVAANKIYVVYQSQKGFEKKGFDIKKIDVNLEENYNDDFEKVSKEIILGLNDKKKSNLVMLSGDPGVGKTMYIRYLTSKLKKNIIFISPDMVNHITDPSFIPFLMNNNESVLIIEDAEPAMEDRGGQGRSGAVSNILNLTDGLLSDCLSISIIATFNTGMKNIDKALLRKGRLLKNYKFEKLSVDKSKALLNKLGKSSNNVKTPMSLADIYYESEENGAEVTETKKVGFGN